MGARETLDEARRLGVDICYEPATDRLHARPTATLREHPKLWREIRRHKHGLVSLARRERAERGEPMQSEAEVFEAFRERAAM